MNLIRFVIFIFTVIFVSQKLTFAQVPNLFKYQAIIRSTDGTILNNSNVKLRTSILKNSFTGSISYTEEHTIATNEFGLTSLSIGTGNNKFGSLDTLDWSSGVYFLKIELDPTTYSGYQDMGTSQLLSVPYAIHSGTSSNAFWKSNNSNIYNQNNGNVGIGTQNPHSKLEVMGTSSLPLDTLFQVKDSMGNTVFAVFSEGVRVYINSSSKAAVGGFAVSGRSTNKTPGNEFFRVTIDSTRIYTTDPIKGFGVQNIDNGNKTSYLHLSPDNYFIGLEAGKFNTSGLNNIFIGKESGFSHKQNDNNIFIGNLTGKKDSIGFNNIYIGNEAGNKLTNGESNIFVGLYSGRNLNIGVHNIFLGFLAGESAISGERNVFIGAGAGLASNSNDNVFIGNWVGMNQKGHSNIMLGHYAGFEDTLGSNNIYIGRHAGRHSISSNSNIFIGLESGMIHKNGANNLFLGNYSGYRDSIGSSNIFIGQWSGAYNKTGANNVFLGEHAGENFNNGNYNTIIGNYAASNKNSGNNNVFIGNGSGQNNVSGDNNVFIGNQAGINETGSDKLYISNSNIDPPLIYGDFSTGNIGLGTTNPTNKLDVNGTTKIGITGTTINSIIKANINFDLPNIDANTSFLANFNVSNVSTNGVVSISPSIELPDGLSISYCRVTAVGIIEVKFRNHTNFPIDLPSINYFFVIID